MAFRPFTLPLALLLLAACARDPEFRTSVASAAYDALGRLYPLLAQADLGTLRTPASFADETGTYAAIIGGFQMSRLLTAGPAPADPATPGDALGHSIARCVAAVRSMAATHKTEGLAPGAPVLPAARAACDAAAAAVAANETSTWLLTTVAGDL